MIEEVWKNRELLKDHKYTDAIRAVIEETDKGRLRVAEPDAGSWKVNEWVKQAILLYFGIQQMKTWTAGPLEFYDKMELKKRLRNIGSPCGSTCCCPLWCVSRPDGGHDAQLCKYRSLCR